MEVDAEDIEQNGLKYDNIIKAIGEFGFYQKRLYTLLVIPAIFSAYIGMSSVFYLSNHAHRCATDQNTTYIPYESSQHSNITVISSECYLRISPAENTSETDKEVMSENTTCRSWVYDTALFEETVISDFNLVCERRHLRSHAKMVLFAGNMAGSLAIGALADIFGRKPTLCLSLVVMVVTSYAIVWAPYYEVFLVLRFIYGVGDSGFYITAFVIGMELVGPSKRIWTGFIINFIWCVGEFLLVGMSYWLRNWRHIELAVAIPMTVFIFYWKLIPESPRWLISRGRWREAVKIFYTAAKVNNISLKDYEFEKQLTLLQNQHSEMNETSKGNKGQIKSTILAVITSKKMLLNTVIMGFNGFVAYVGYYGLSLAIGNLAGDIYLNFLISVVVEFFAYLMCIILFDKVGHRRFHIGCLIIGGTASLGAVVTSFLIKNSPSWITVMSAMIGKLCVSAIFAEIFVYVSELYPTSVRTFVLGIMSLVGQIGSVASPYIADIAYYIVSDFGQALPIIIFGISMVVAGILALFLPETNQTHLPDTIKEAKSLGRSKINGHT